MVNRITLVMPGLGAAAGPSAEFHRLPGLGRLLRSASVVEAPPDLDTVVWQRAGGAGPCPAVAPLTRLADTGHKDAHWWLRADPVCLVAGAADAALVTQAGPTPDEAAQLAAAIGAHLADEDLLFEAPTADRWYLGSTETLDARTVSPGQAARAGVARSLPGGAHGARLCALMTDVQMLLHDHPVNSARSSRDLPAINGVWLWGGGRIPAPDAMPADRPALASDQPYARGLWALAGATAASAPASFDEMPVASGDRLVVLDGADMPLAQLDRAWFEPLVAQVRAGHLDILEVVDNGICIDLRHARNAGWWRRLGARLGTSRPRWPWST